MLLNKARLYLSRISIFMILLSLLPLQASASQITSRSLTLGSSAASAVTTHKFTFTVPSSTLASSVQFSYCTTATGSCTVPTGLTTTSATASGLAGFTIVATTNGAPYLTDATPTNISGAQVITLSNVTNTSTLGTFYVRMTTYSSANATTGAIDAGIVASSIANQIVISAVVPESLTFCVYNTGGTCADTSTTTIALGNLSTGATSSGTSKFDASTNANSGYIVTVNGATLTSGSNTIPAYNTLTASPATGTSGFGMNLVVNTAPAVTGSANVTTGTAPSIGAPTANYGTSNSFKFTSLDTIASATGPTNTNTFTASYIANLGGAQAAGTYTTTLTYICTATF